MGTSLLRKGDARALVKFLTDTKINFELIRSNYAMEVKSELIHDKFVNTMQSKRVFAAFAKIKSNVKDKPKPEVSREDCVYYQHNFKESFFQHEVMNIDLGKAYATVLKNDKIISIETYDYICKLPKQSRLVCVGMLASRKKSFIYKAGNIVDYSEIISDNSPFFFYAVKRTFEIMSDLKNICGDNYLFTWVDGIYFTPNAEIAAECKRYLDGIGFGHTIESLKDFTVKFLPRKIMLVFKKWNNNKNIWDIKSFNLPHKETISQKIAMNICTASPIKRKII